MKSHRFLLTLSIVLLALNLHAAESGPARLRHRGTTSRARDRSAGPRRGHRFDSALEVSAVTRATHQAVVQLYRALGGGWRAR